MITNTGDISLTLAVWLLHDEYDYVDAENYISATALMKPLRHLVLPSRIPAEQRTSDVEDFISRALGHSLHDSIEKAWTKGYAKSLAKLGYPQDVIDRVRINPTPEEVRASNSIIPVYMEQRTLRTFQGYTIGGKFDFVAEGIVQDLKSTTAYTWLAGTKDDDYRLQMSLYKWLNPDKITEDFGRINFIFTDWQRAQARQNPRYPQRRVLHKDIPLMTLAQTEDWISAKLAQVEKYRAAPEHQIPECTVDELWQGDPQYKYYADPTKTQGRSSKNFTDPIEARKFMAEEKSGKGVIITIPGEPRRCAYCDAFPVCTQKDKFFP
jgi:hypothetical protein